MNRTGILDRLGLTDVVSGVYAGEWIERPGGETIESVCPADGEVLARITVATAEDAERAIRSSEEAFRSWREIPAPKRGQVVRDMADALRAARDDLGALITLEMGKIRAEGVGEIQEAIDIADFSVGLSRQLYGLSMHSERPSHRMYEQWHPLGIVGIITAFNFPIAVWAWNSMIAAVCGDSMIWKPSSKTPLTAIATTRIAATILEDHGHPGVMNLLVGSGKVVGEKMLADRRLPLISATGSCRMGRRLAQVVGQRLGRSLLELGGNNAIIVLRDADLDLALRAILFGAIGTSGQRCTTTRRLILDRPIAKTLVDRLVAAYRQIRIGDPLSPETVMGPLVDRTAVAEYETALATIREQGGEIVYGGEVLGGDAWRSGCFVLPTIVRATRDLPIMQEEVFAPILYVVEVDGLDEAIDVQNGVDQGLSSAIFTDSVRSAETFLSPRGSDCGIANVNIGTSGAEIGGAFGGEKDTGGGREAGSDSWKIYMRRQTTTINWGRDLPLAQGIRFG